MNEELMRELGQECYKEYDFRLRMTVIGAARGMPYEWIIEKAHAAMLAREYWYLATEQLP